jgi:NADPH:quinone reductase-like Zn-dependent oxidoreductase
MKGDITLHIPDSLGFEEAATLGCGIFTIGVAFYRDLGLPLPTLPLRKNEKSNPLLIYGGSTATGTFGIQFAKL